MTAEDLPVRRIREGLTTQDALTDKHHWGQSWDKPPRLRLPSRLVVATRNTISILRREIKPGMRVIAIPNDTGIYRWLQQRLDLGNLALHNLDILSREGLLDLVPDAPASAAEAFPSGRVNTSLLSVHRVVSSLKAVLLQAAGNVLGRLQIVTLRGLSPLWVLRIHRA